MSISACQTYSLLLFLSQFLILYHFLNPSLSHSRTFTHPYFLFFLWAVRVWQLLFLLLPLAVLQSTQARRKVCYAFREKERLRIREKKNTLNKESPCAFGA